MSDWPTGVCWKSQRNLYKLKNGLKIAYLQRAITWEPTGQLQPFLDQNQQGQTDGPNGLYKKARERAAAQQQQQ